MPTPASKRVFRLRVALDDVVPTVWRHVLVPGGIRLAQLHDIFQVAMGWTNSHLHSFTIGEELYGMQLDDYPEDELDETQVTVQDAIGEHREFVYEYDFGDSWRHQVVVEEVVASGRGLKFAVCLDGQNACPPEDCGGAYGYAELLGVLHDPSHEDHDDVLQWVGADFDPTAFDLVAVNVALQQLR